jgi:tRNA1(Val) A37 N6-methylase TrmN6
VTSPGKALRAAGLVPGSYQHLIANPPFYDEGRVREAPNAARAAAHVMDQGGLAAWMRFFAAMGAPNARLTLIHRPDSLGELLTLLDGRFGDVAVFPLFPKKHTPATRIIVRATKGSRAGISLLPGLQLHEDDGRYTAQAEAILRHGEALSLRPAKGKGRRLGG